VRTIQKYRNGLYSRLDLRRNKSLYHFYFSLKFFYDEIFNIRHYTVKNIKLQKLICLKPDSMKISTGSGFLFFRLSPKESWSTLKNKKDPPLKIS
jgi:hypothetical protein